jgi:hypothetical protein
MKKCAGAAALVWLLMVLAVQAQAWQDKTHVSIAKAAGYEYWFNAAGADMAKIKAGTIEIYNHWYNNNSEVKVTPEMVLDQASRYNKVDEAIDEQGHLYGAIISAIRSYEQNSAAGKYGEYHMAYACHYIGDLSNPLHNIANDEYNTEHHKANDAVVEKNIFGHTEKITNHMYPITLRDDHFEADLAREISRIANISRNLGYKLRSENRDMTPAEAYIQLGHSASLLKAVLKHFR